MDAVAEGGSGLRVVKIRLRRLDGKNELAEAGREGRTRLTNPNSQARTLLLLLLLLFLTFSVLVANPKKLLYTVANPARGLLNREKRTKEKVWQHTPPPTPHTARSEKINKITRRIYRRYAGGRSRVRTRIPSARRLGLWVWLRNSTLPSAIIRFPVSLLLSSPGDV